MSANPEDEANARLISASPDLLESCVCFREFCAWIIHAPEKDFERIKSAAKRHWKSIDKALAKAEGCE